MGYFAVRENRSICYRIGSKSRFEEKPSWPDRMNASKNGAI